MIENTAPAPGVVTGPTGVPGPALAGYAGAPDIECTQVRRDQERAFASALRKAGAAGLTREDVVLSHTHRPAPTPGGIALDVYTLDRAHTADWSPGELLTYAHRGLAPLGGSASIGDQSVRVLVNRS